MAAATQPAGVRPLQIRYGLATRIGWSRPGDEGPEASKGYAVHIDGRSTPPLRRKRGAVLVFGVATWRTSG